MCQSAPRCEPALQPMAAPAGVHVAQCCQMQCAVRLRRIVVFQVLLMLMACGQTPLAGRADAGSQPNAAEAGSGEAGRAGSGSSADAGDVSTGGRSASTKPMGTPTQIVVSNVGSAPVQLGT